MHILYNTSPQTIHYLFLQIFNDFAALIVWSTILRAIKVLGEHETGDIDHQALDLVGKGAQFC